MDEYFCPNCDAILNYQEGFDPSGGAWTCTSCGKLLMDEDVYDGDSYEGVAWFCDTCNALLNRQSGFSDSLGNWICTECGHLNGITDEDIIEDPFYCPNCGEILNKQWGFYKYDDNHECSLCGAKLYHSYSDDKYSVVEDEEIEEDNNFLCPNCGAILNDQLLFSSYEDNWECSECGMHLYHNFSSEPYFVKEDDSEETSEYYEKISCSNASDSMHNKYTVNEENKRIKVKRLPDEGLRKKRIKAFLFKRKKIENKYNCSDLLGRDRIEVETLLHNQAFNNIKLVPIKDIYSGSKYEVGEVEQVVIAGSSYFCEGDMIPYNAEIIITYHEKKEIQMPYTSRKIKKMKYQEAVDMLHELGYTEICGKKIEDLKVGLLKKDGTIEKITIVGNNEIKKNRMYEYDVKITIVYHTFKDKGRKEKKHA